MRGGDDGGGGAAGGAEAGGHGGNSFGDASGSVDRRQGAVDPFRPACRVLELPQGSGSRLAAAASSSHRVARRPCTAPAGSSVPGAPRTPRATASALASPATSSQTSSAPLIAEKPRLIRVGGGFGQSCTGTTGRSSRAAGESGKIDATCPSGPMPSSRTSKRGRSPSPASSASSPAYQSAASSAVANSPSDAGIACTRTSGTPTRSSSARRAPRSLRSSLSAGTNRSSP